MSGGKGSAPRPIQVDPKTFSDNWDAAFGKKKDVTQQDTIKIKKSKPIGCKRIIRIVSKDGHLDLNITKATKIMVSKPVLYLEEMADGNFRLTYSGNLISDFSEVVRFDIIREDM